MQHGSKVCYIACMIAEHMDLNEGERTDLYYSALLHDLGLSSTKQLIDIMQTEAKGEFSHCERGYALLKRCPYTNRFSRIVLHHHDKWAGTNESGIMGNDIPVCSRIINVANRVDVLIQPREYILYQKDDIVKAINRDSGTLFDPQVVKAFNQVAYLESFWLDLATRHAEELLYKNKPMENVTLNYEELEDIAIIFAQMVDSKSTFTLRHSRRVASVAVALAERLKFLPIECEMIKIAALLHDLGNLSIPDEILDKRGKLTKDEYKIIKRHTYFTYFVLNKIKGFDTISQWASQHHERLDGQGYPFHTKAETLPLGARILAVSDTLTALAEDRPYRKAYPTESICEILNQCVSEGALDGEIVNVVTENINEFCKLFKVE